MGLARPHGEEARSAVSSHGPPHPSRRALRALLRMRRIEVYVGSATARRAAAGVALHAGAVAHQSEVAAFAAGLALVAPGAGLGALLRGRRLGVDADVVLVDDLELLRRRQLGLR